MSLDELNTDFVPVSRLTRDLTAAASTLGDDEARFLVSAYYALQESRIRGAGRTRALASTSQPHAVVQWLAHQDGTLESQVLRALSKYTEASPLGQWARSVCGIGPVIAAGLLAHIDLSRAPTVGHIWRFAGLDPTVRWEKGRKRPWNAELKTLCWKIGESFVKVQSNEKDVYGAVYAARKESERIKNEAGAFAEQAAAVLTAKRFGADTKAKTFYERGMLPPAHIHARAKRYAVKLFLAHYHEQGCRLILGVEPPAPYPLAILGHAHRVAAPEQN